MKLLNFADLVEMGVVTNRMTLKRMIDGQGFPRGRMISANRRMWTADEIKAYVDSRPIARDAEAGERDSAPSTGEAA